MPVQPLRFFEITDVEVNVTVASTAWDTLPSCVWRGNQMGKVQRQGRYLEFLPMPRPHLPLSVGVHLYCEPVRIFEVYGFAYQVVATCRTDTALMKVLGKARECGPGWQQ